MAQAPSSARASSSRETRLQPQLADVRRRHLANLLANPNYYGTAPGSQLAPVLELSGNTAWEELECLGFNPRLGQIEAVAVLKRPTGYNGDLCSLGSTEYVRFFVDWHDGAGFHDVGLASFEAHDIPDAKLPDHPLHYLVTLTLSAADRERCCSSPVLPTLRATLDWNHVPPPDPNYNPPFGNSRDANIQLETGFCSIFDLLGEELVQDKAVQLQGVDLSAPLQKLKPTPVPWSALADTYRQHEVPTHRLVYQAVYPLVVGDLETAQAASQPDIAKSAEIGIDLNAAIAVLADGNGDTSFEQLTCVGLNTATDTLGAVIQIKRPLGYSGDLCRSGSQEYVAFWADWDRDGVYEAYLGTTAVNVHDINPLPRGGLFYSVSLPVNVSEHLRGCSSPNVVPIRGVLSWAIPPSTTNPNDLKFWGNRLDVLVQIRPGERTTGLYDLLYDVGYVPIANISKTTFLAYPSSGALSPSDCGRSIMDRPFSGNTRIGGRIYNSGPSGTVKYRVQFSKHNANAWMPVSSTDLALELMHPNPIDPLYPMENRTISQVAGFYPYSEDWAVNPPILERTAHLADWNVSALTNGYYDVRLEYTVDFVTYFHSQIVTVVVNNVSYAVSPDANAVVDPAYTVDMVIDGGDCHSYDQTIGIKGHLRAVHPFFGGWSLDLQPSTHTHATQASPPCRVYTSLTDTGADPSEVWALDTKNLDKCGYTLTLRAYERRIVSNDHSAPSVSKAVGFSIV